MRTYQHINNYFTAKQEACRYGLHTSNRTNQRHRF